MSTINWRAHLATGVAVVILALFVALNLMLALGNGVCCADDALFATVAKNLAWGVGYSTTLDFAVTPFDPNITTGPALILPVSAAIGIVGNKFWLPGTVHVMLWTLLLLAAWRAFGSLGLPGRPAWVVGLFVLVVYAMSPYHLEQWYAVLGEAPAALTILVGIGIWAADPRSSRRALAAGVLCSLGVLMKLLAFLYVGTLLASAAAISLWDSRDLKHLVRGLGPLLLGLLLPILLFELWKLTSLGVAGYLVQMRALEQFVSSEGTGGTVISLAEVANRLRLFSARFGASLPILVVVAVLGGSLSWRAGSPAFRRLYVVLLIGVLVHACYWLTLSVSWPRRVFTGVTLLSALLALPYLALNRPGRIVLYSAALALSLVSTTGRLDDPIVSVRDAWSNPSSLRSSQVTAGRFLEVHQDRRTFVSQWWAPVADLQYLSKNVRDFKRYTALTAKDLDRGVLVVTNSRFDLASDKQFSSFVAGCGPPVLTAAPYAIHECHDGKALPWISAVVPTTTTPADIPASASVSVGSCHVEAVGARSGGLSSLVLRRGDVLRLDGWIVDEHAGGVPARPYVAFQSVGSHRHIWYSALEVGLPREDVARAKQHEGYRASGFSLSVDTAPMPPAEYRLFLLFRGSGRTFTCDNGRRMVVQ